MTIRAGWSALLDAVGDRWALLVVRELIFGPKRFSQLRDGLHGVSPNVLSQRLRDLEEGGIVRRDALDPQRPASRSTSSPRGAWHSSRSCSSSAAGAAGSRCPRMSRLTASAVLLALKTVFDPAAAGHHDVAASR